MKKYIIIISTLIFGISCRNQIVQDSEKVNLRMIDSILSSSELPLMNKFDLADNLVLPARKWKPLNKNRKVESLFYKAFLENNKILGYWKDYQELYQLGKIEYKEKKYLVISQWIRNGDECYMYLIDINKKAHIEKLLLIAKQYKSPDDYNYCLSKIIDGNLKRTTVKWYNDSFHQEPSTKDSIIELFELKELRRIKYDSIRIQ